MRGQRGTVVAVALLVLAAAPACGEDDDTTTRAGWRTEHADLVAAYEKDLEAARDTINRGERQATISACTQLADDATEMRSEVFPVPDPAVDVPLRQSVDLALQGADDCIQGGRSSADAGARQVEAAMKEIADARQRYLEAKAAFEAWR